MQRLLHCSNLPIHLIQGDVFHQDYFKTIFRQTKEEQKNSPIRHISCSENMAIFVGHIEIYSLKYF